MSLSRGAALRRGVPSPVAGAPAAGRAAGAGAVRNSIDHLLHRAYYSQKITFANRCKALWSRVTTYGVDVTRSRRLCMRMRRFMHRLPFRFRFLYPAQVAALLCGPLLALWPWALLCPLWRTLLCCRRTQPPRGTPQTDYRASA